MISPVLDKDQTTVDVYIPDDVWYDYYTVSTFNFKSLCIIAQVVLIIQT